MAASVSYLFDKLGLVALACVAALVLWRFSTPPAAQPVPVGTPMPPLGATGWLNVPAGESFDPSGKIVVVDCWATYCLPCREEIPRLAILADQYRPLGVEFVGLTSETQADLPRLRDFIDATPGFDWPVGYGAFPFMAALDVRAIPTLIVFAPDGRATWSGRGAEGLEAALDAALAAR